MSSLNATTTDNLRPFPLRIPLKDVPALDDDELSIDASLDSLPSPIRSRGLRYSTVTRKP